MHSFEQGARSRYVVELRRPELGWSELEALTGRARAAAAELSQSGSTTRFLRAVFVPEDDSCYLLLEGESRDSVRHLLAHAELAFDGFVETLSRTHPKEAPP